MAASFTHVHDWTMTNSPDGTPLGSTAFSLTTLGVKRVAAVLGTGPDRARRLIEELDVPVPVPA